MSSTFVALMLGLGVFAAEGAGGARAETKLTTEVFTGSEAGFSSTPP